ncbi:hypothetical protein RI060_26510 [Streptomyces janthinus]|uniref:Uncharacterized protein n=1 Tax=Streptomyces violaceus TaxID=1936 RepID=A0ABY9UMD6_STRVL|nr:hypothetical protein [Streptomyces janthinus]WND24048.1 hypothetical protein RI060_26510 [Streptomyces janthinus]
MDGPTGFRGDFVGRVLDELEELTVAVSALGDAPFAVRVFRDQPGVDFVGLQNPGGLLDHGSQHRGRLS